MLLSDPSFHQSELTTTFPDISPEVACVVPQELVWILRAIVRETEKCVS